MAEQACELLVAILSLLFRVHPRVVLLHLGRGAEYILELLHLWIVCHSSLLPSSPVLRMRCADVPVRDELPSVIALLHLR